MEAKIHITVTTILGIFGLGLLFPYAGFLESVGILAMALVAGALIDLDHFLWARYNQEDWSATVNALKSPLGTMTNNESVIGENAVNDPQKYLSHFLILGVLYGLLHYTHNTYMLYYNRVVALMFLMSCQHILLDIIQTIGSCLNVQRGNN